jgi:hypothetical protein
VLNLQRLAAGRLLAYLDRIGSRADVQHMVVKMDARDGKLVLHLRCVLPQIGRIKRVGPKGDVPLRVRYADGKKVIVPNEGIGSNYWDLLPFGGEDALATIYDYDALRDLAELEEQIVAHPGRGEIVIDGFVVEKCEAGVV